MPPVPFSLRRNVTGAACVLLTGIALTALIGPVLSRGLDRNQQCVSNLRQISRGVENYAQDYDQRLPQPIAFSSIANFKSLVGIYITGPNPPSSDTAYRCPANGNAYYTLNTALGGTGLYQFPDAYTVEVARDSKPHPDGSPNIGYLDGHAERNGVNQTPTDLACRQNMRQASLAVFAYAQDYDQRFPFAPNDADFRQSLTPYTKTTRVLFCPDTQQPYNISQSFRGKSHFEIPDPSPIILFQDATPHHNGIVTTAYLDGYIEQRGANGGLLYPNPNTSYTPDVSLSNVKQIGLALQQYIQDYDERLPLYSNYPDLLKALTPYVSPYIGSRGLYNFNQPTYQADPALSGVFIASIQNTADTIFMRDVYNFGDGFITAGYLDGHAKRIPAGPQHQGPPPPNGSGKGTDSVYKN